MKTARFALFVLVLFCMSAVAQTPAGDPQKFIEDAQTRLYELSVKAAKAQWVQANFITDDTEFLAADANQVLTGEATEFAKATRRFEGLKLDPQLSRKLVLLKLSLTAPAPSDPKELQELTRVAASLEADYGKAKVCPKQGPHAGKCLDITALERIFEKSRDPNELRDLWVGWHQIAPPMRQRYSRLVELSNKGAKDMGFADTGALWRSNYDMPPDAFAKDVERLWQQVRPLYESLHAYVRTKLAEKYGPQVVPADGMLPGHLLGNMWAQEWGNIYDIVKPANDERGYDVTELLKAKNVDARGMVRYGENFFKSLGFAPLPETFWERSLFTKPQDRDVVCHASAWDVDSKDDLRLKMCIQIREEDFITVHHELGHNFYQRAYKNQPFLFQSGANDGFHEAVGDAIALSVTPEYLVKVGLLDKLPANNSDIGYLLREGMDKIAFLPFGLMIDQWRWKVFSGQIAPANYNQAWWEMRNRYQGISAPVPRTDADFDPGAKYHVPANVPYTRYFLARVLQFQFHRAMCRAAGYQGPLHRCSIYGNKEAGAKLARMLESGQSQPWQQTLKEMTGESDIDGGALLDYFAPLKQWLDQQNKGKKIGWTVPSAHAD
jgi:peptidyl-dipeptidase A